MVSSPDQFPEKLNAGYVGLACMNEVSTMKKRVIAQGIEAFTQGLESITKGTVTNAPLFREVTGPGRPKADARQIAKLAHIYMLRTEISGIKGVQAIRKAAGSAINLGNQGAPENQERQMRRDIAKAEKALQGAGIMLTFSGDEAGEGRCWYAVEDVHDGVCSAVTQNIDGISIDGWGWVCAFGEHSARYGRIQTQGGTEIAP